MKSIDSLIDFVTNWRSNHTYTTRADGSLSENSLFDLLTGINERIGKHVVKYSTFYQMSIQLMLSYTV